MGKVVQAWGWAAAALLAAGPASAQISVGISVRVAPPPLPVYVQPPLPGPDYVWTPGYWAWDDIADAYYWVPGAWMLAPRPGLLWTPPWWGWQDGLYVFHSGYWGPHVGFYGGVPYGFGSTGFGFQGGYWRGGHFAYNSVVTNITNVHVTNVYRQNVVVNPITRISYNGGPGGIAVRPTPQQLVAVREAHVAPNGRPMPPMTAPHDGARGFGAPSGPHGPASVSVARANAAPSPIGVPAMMTRAPMPVVHRGHGASPPPMADMRQAGLAPPEMGWRGAASMRLAARPMPRPGWGTASHGPPRVAFRPPPPPRPAPHPSHGEHHPPR